MPDRLRQTSHFDPQHISTTIPVEMLIFLARQTLAASRYEVCEKSGLVLEFGVLDEVLAACLS